MSDALDADRLDELFKQRGTSYAQTLGRVARQMRSENVQRGKVVEAVGTLVRASGVTARVGELCALSEVGGEEDRLAEVVGFSGQEILLSPMGGIEGVSPATHVRPLGRTHAVAVGDFLLGRVVDGLGARFLDDGPGMPRDAVVLPVTQDAPAPLSRRPINQPIDLQVRALDTMLTCGVGQRLGVFASAGCGKSTLMSMMCQHAEADVIVVALVGERGREVTDFLAEALTPDSRQRCIVVVSTSDRPSGERMKAAFVATTYAEHFSAQGKSVLLLVDSVTRIARAAREIGLATGEPPTRRGYPPSVFTLLPRLFERAGRLGSGAITGFYTVLEETDDGSDPISEEVRSLLDGHIILSRKLANKGHYPAIDVLMSASRLMGRLVSSDHLEVARRTRELLSKYEDVELLLRIGEYQPGMDPEADQAVDAKPHLDAFMRQTLHEAPAAADALEALRALVR